MIYQYTHDQYSYFHIWYKLTFQHCIHGHKKIAWRTSLAISSGTNLSWNERVSPLETPAIWRLTFSCLLLSLTVSMKKTVIQKPSSSSSKKRKSADELILDAARQRLLNPPQNKKDDDEHDIFGKYVASQLRELDWDQRAHSRKLMVDVLYAAGFKTLTTRSKLDTGEGSYENVYRSYNYQWALGFFFFLLPMITNDSG